MSKTNSIQNQNPKNTTSVTKKIAKWLCYFAVGILAVIGAITFYSRVSSVVRNKIVAKKAFKTSFNNIKENPEDADAWYKLALFYEYGYGTKEDDKSAFECYLNSVNNSEGKEFTDNISQAYYDLGLCYMTGKGTKADFNKAYQTFEKLVSLEPYHSEAWFNLGICNIARKIPQEEYQKIYQVLEEEYGSSLEGIVKEIPYFVYFENQSLLKDFVLEQDYEQSREYFWRAKEFYKFYHDAISYLGFFYRDLTPEWFVNFIKNDNPTSSELFLLERKYSENF